MVDKKKIQAMREGGKLLGQIRQTVADAVIPGVSFEELEALTMKLILDHGAKPSFPTVDGYKYATCITKNEGCCHGVPVGKHVDKGDLITLDMGLIWNGYHLDTTTTVYAGDKKHISGEIAAFMQVGQDALAAGIAQATAGNSVYDISKAIQRTIEAAGCSPVYQLTGHAVGKNLHEDPQIPCVTYRGDKKIRLEEGMTLAIEPMYAAGNAYLILGEDGWTYQTKDKSLTGMYEHTVLVTRGEPEILTSSS